MFASWIGTFSESSSASASTSPRRYSTSPRSYWPRPSVRMPAWFRHSAASGVSPERIAESAHASYRPSAGSASRRAASTSARSSIASGTT